MIGNLEDKNWGAGLDGDMPFSGLPLLAHHIPGDLDNTV